MKIVAIVLVAVTAMSSPRSADAQQRARTVGPEWSHVMAEQENEIPLSVLIAGSTLGWIGGLAAGAAVGYLVEPDAGESWVGAREWWIGGYVGSSFGAALGAHLTNGRRGNLLHGSIASLLVGPVLFAATFPVGGAGLALTPVVQIGASVRIERLSGAGVR